MEDFSQLKFLIIVSYYDYDISWTQKLKLPYRIYYKDQIDKEPFNAKNKGKSETNIFKFIYDFYYYLPHNVIFVHQYEYKWYHYGSLVDILNEPNLPIYLENSKTDGYMSLNIKDSGDIQPQVRRMVDSGWWSGTMFKYFNNISNYHNFSKNKNCGSQFIVSKDRILSLPRDFYGNMYNWIVKNEVGEVGSRNSNTNSRTILLSDNNIRSNYYISRYLEWSYELIFSTYKETENNYFKFVIDNRKIELLVLYGYDKYYINVTKIFYQNFIKGNQIIIEKNIYFNGIFSDYLYGVIKNLKINIKNKKIIVLEETLTEDFIYKL